MTLDVNYTKSTLSSCILSNISNSSLYNSSRVPGDVSSTSLWYDILVGLILAIVMLMTVVGNGFVIVAVWKDTRLHTLANKLVASLAVADFLVGLLVMPLSAVHLLLGKWPFKSAICDAFITADVLFCTSSILHLVAISVDRYKTVTDISYNRVSSKKHKYFVPGMICGAWLLSAAVCLPPFFGWRTEQKEESCVISQDRGYTIYSTIGAFYIPLIIILVIYTKIFLVIRYRVRRKAFSKAAQSQPMLSPTPVIDKKLPPSQTVETIVNNNSFAKSTTDIDNHNSPCEDTTFTVNLNESSTNHLSPHITIVSESQSNSSRRSSFQQLMNDAQPLNKRRPEENKKSKQEKIAQKRERKAFRTLAIITGVFITCWLPFFIFAVVGPFCNKCNIPILATNFVTWLGYFNCALNPIIYTIFSPDFRAAFKKILTNCVCRN